MREDLHRELWTSFASLLSGYGAAHGMNSRHQAILEVGSDVVLARAGSRWIRFTRDSFTTSENLSSAFSLKEDGSVEIDGKIEEMDFAAERLTRELMQDT